MDTHTKLIYNFWNKEVCTDRSGHPKLKGKGKNYLIMDPNL